MKQVFFTIIIFLPVLTWGQIPLKVGVPTGQDPHVYILNQQILGEEGTLLDRALRTAGFNPTYEHFPSLRAIERIRNGLIDAIINVKEESLSFAFKSSFTYEFQNCAVAKAKRKLHLNETQDFKNLDVVAFKNAHTSLNSSRIAEIMKVAKSYREIQSVEMRIRLLNADRVDIMLTEKTVFLHYIEKYKLGEAQNYSFYCLFKPTPYKLVFRSEQLRDHFEKNKK